MKAARGFTLLEVMVVLVLISITSVLLSQMLTIMLRGYEQIGPVQSQINRTEMRNGWFRHSIGVMRASLDAEFAFAGTSDKIDGFTMAPLVAPQGKLTRISWELRRSGDASQLWYHEPPLKPMLIGEWLDASLEFQYRGLQSGWVDVWPADDLPPGVLPYRVKLSVDREDTVEEIYASINVRRLGRYDYRDVL